MPSFPLSWSHPAERCHRPARRTQPTHSPMSELFGALRCGVSPLSATSGCPGEVVACITTGCSVQTARPSFAWTLFYTHSFPSKRDDSPGWQACHEHRRTRITHKRFIVQARRLRSSHRRSARRPPRSSSVCRGSLLAGVTKRMAVARYQVRSHFPHQRLRHAALPFCLGQGITTILLPGRRDLVVQGRALRHLLMSGASKCFRRDSRMVFV